MRGDLWITGDPQADGLLNSDPTALVIGMLLDQQVPLEWAFAGPATLRRRLGHLDAERLAATDVEALVAACCAKPAIHRFPAVMGRRIHALCQALVADWNGDAEQIWATARSGAELRRRLTALPGFGDEKAMILVAVLAKRFGVRPPGWKRAAGPFADAKPRTVADASSPETLAGVRAWKQNQRAAGLDKHGRAVR